MIAHLPKIFTLIKIEFFMLLHARPFDLQLRHPFTIANYSRTHTPVVFVEIHDADDHVGRGEAALPPYLGETQASVLEFLSKTTHILAAQKTDLTLSKIAFLMAQIDALAVGHTAAKASVDIALHHLFALQTNIPLWQHFGVSPDEMPLTSCTLGIDTAEVLREKVHEAADFEVLKIKLGSADDRTLIQTIRQATQKPLYVDANQGWRNREWSLDFAHWLHSEGVQLIEQPFEKHNLSDTAWLAERSPIPIIADESCQRLGDMAALSGVFHGINIKLMKCTGLTEARQMIEKAHAWQFKILMGCMTESSCAIMAAAQIAPLCDWCDLDGPWLIANNPFATPTLINGRIVLDDF
jgi:L-Ala-D/L-Glu epimerase